MRKKIIFYGIFGLTIIAMLIAMILIPLTISKELGGRLGYELKEVYTVDHILYFTVARGILQGSKPYADFYENKPPLIFLLCALSYAIRGDFHLINIFSFISLLLMIAIPVAYLIYKCIKNKANPLIFLMMALPVISITLIITLYTEVRSGEAQTELFGAVSSMAALLCILLGRDDDKFYSPTVIISGFFLGVAAMFKEPHAVLLVVLMMMLVKNKRDIFTKVLFPLGYAVQTILLILICSNCLDSYFTIYLKNMFSSHINLYGSPFIRAFNLANLVTDMKNYAEYMPHLVGILLLTVILTFAFKVVVEQDLKQRIYKMMRFMVLLLGLYTTGFVVGLGGQYFNHHYVFAIPFYFTLMFICIDELPVEKVRLFANLPDDKLIDNPSIVYSSILFAIAVFSVPLSIKTYSTNSNKYHQDTSVVEKVKGMKELASYIDEICDALDEEHYLFLGFNGYHMYGYSKHMPYGPIFAQDRYNFSDPDSFFAKSFLENLYETNILVYYRNNTGSISMVVDRYIQKEFTTRVPAAVEGIEMPVTVDSKNYKMMYRSKTYGLDYIDPIDPGDSK